MRLLLSAVVLSLTLASCGGANAPSAPDSAVTPLPTPAIQRLYVEYTNTIGAPFATGIAVYALPLTSSSVPSVLVSGNFGPLAFDVNGNLFTSTLNEIDEYAAPLSSTSAGAKVIGQTPAKIPTYVNDIAFDASGNLWAQTSYDLRDFPPPINGASTAQTILSGGGVNQIVFSPSGSMYTGPIAPAYGASITLMNYGAPPYTAPPKTIHGVTFGAPIGYTPDGNVAVYTNGYVLNGQIQPPALEIVQPPLSSTSVVNVAVPFNLFASLSTAHTAQVDAQGNVYALNASAGNAVDVFSWPLQTGATPAARLTCVRIAGACQTAIALYLGP